MADLDVRPASGAVLWNNGGAAAGAASTSYGRSLLAAADAAALRTLAALGSAAVATLIDDDTMATATVVNIPSAESVVAYIAGFAGGDIDSADTTVAPAGNYWDFVLNLVSATTADDTKLPTWSKVKAYVDGLTTLASADTNMIDVYTSAGVTLIGPGPGLVAATGAFTDATFSVESVIGTDRVVDFDCSAIVDSTTRTVTWPNSDGTVVLAGLTQTLLLKTLAAPVIGVGYLGTAASGARTDSATRLAELTAAQAVTIDFASGTANPMVQDFRTLSYLQAGSTNVATRFLQFKPTIENEDSSAAINIGGGRLIEDGATVRANTQTGIGAGNWISFRAAPSFTITNGGTITSGTHTGFSYTPATAAGVTMATLSAFSTAINTFAGAHTTYNHFKANNCVVTGSLAIQYGLDITALAAATVNVGIRNASNHVETPTIRTLTVVGDSLSATSTEVRSAVIELNNTSGGSLTLTSAPTLPTGIDGQVVTIFNGSAQNVVLSDQGTLASSNLRLSAATITLATRDSIVLRYSSTVGDWIQVGQTNVI